jgi:hypothetical protein
MPKLDFWKSAGKFLLAPLASVFFLAVPAHAHQTKSLFTAPGGATPGISENADLVEIPKPAIMALVGLGLLGLGTLLRRYESGKKKIAPSIEASEPLAPLPPRATAVERTPEPLPQRVQSASNSR